MTAFGALALSAMVLAYALEGRHRIFVGVFAAACAASSAYGFLIGSIPFGLAEGLWSLVALRRLRRSGGLSASLGRVRRILKAGGAG